MSEITKMIIYICLCIGCLIFGHFMGRRRGIIVATENAKVIIVFDEDYNLLGVYVNGFKIPIANVSARIETYAIPNNEERKDKK